MYDFWRPQYHFTPQKGWINDPNGLVCFQGQYHLFYQFNPYHCNWDSMHWGHAVSEDLLNWKEAEIALFPDQNYDNSKEGGCFSGSVIQKEGKLFLLYTGSLRDKGHYSQAHCLAVSEDGLHFKKWESNPVIPSQPERYGPDFRDPKVIWAEGKWRMICGGTDRDADDPTSCGVIFLYCSDDLYHWEYQGILYRDEGCSMFECPDLFQVGEKWIITSSPMNRSDYAPNIYLAGTIDFEKGIFIKERESVLDGGTHYYAAQTYEVQGELLSVGWLGGWLWMPWIRDFGPLDQAGFRGILSIPRKVTADSQGTLYFSFARIPDGIKTYRVADREPFEIEPTEESFYLQLASAESDFAQPVRIRIAEDRNCEAVFDIDFQKQTLTANYENADDHSRYGIRRMNLHETVHAEVQLLRDGCTFTLILGDGADCYTTLLFPEEGKIGVTVEYYREEI